MLLRCTGSITTAGIQFEGGKVYDVNDDTAQRLLANFGPEPVRKEYPNHFQILSSPDVENETVVKVAGDGSMEEVDGSTYAPPPEPEEPEVPHPELEVEEPSNRPDASDGSVTGHASQNEPPQPPYPENQSSVTTPDAGGVPAQEPTFTPESNVGTGQAEAQPAPPPPNE